MGWGDDYHGLAVNLAMDPFFSSLKELRWRVEQLMKTALEEVRNGPLLEEYAEIAGYEVVDHLRQMAEPLAGMKVVHVNSTREGGGVAEILIK